MVNSFRSSNPITPLGTNGALPALPAAEIAAPIMANPQDRTQDLLQRTRDSVDRGFQAQASVLQTAAETGQAAAANRTQNSAGGVFSGLLSAVGAGFTLYAELEDKKAVRKAEIAKLEAEAADEAARLEAARQLEQDENLKAQLELEISETAQDLLTEAGTATFEQGNIVTRRQFVRSMVQDSGLPPQMQSELMRMFYEQTGSIQSGLNTRQLNQIEEVADSELQINKQMVVNEITPLLVQLRAGNVGTVNPESVEQQINTRLTSFFNENNIAFADRLHITAEVYGLVGTAYTDYGIRTTEINVKQQLLASAINEYDVIIQQTEGNTEARNLALQALGAKYASQGLSGIDWTGIQVSEEERLRLDALRREAQAAVQEDALRNDPVAQTFMNAVAWETAYDLFARPGQLSAERSRLERSDDLLDQATLANLNTLLEVRDGVAENQVARNTLASRRSELLVEWERAKDQLDPTGRLGPLTMTEPNAQELVQLANSALQRGEISPETARALGRNIQEQLRALDEEERELNRSVSELSNLLSGTGISPLSITSYDTNMPRLRQAVQAATPAMEARRAELEARPSAQNDPVNFSAGPAVSVPPVVPLATNADGITWPAAATELDSLNPTSAYGMRTHPISGRQAFHSGIDVVIPSGNVLSIAGGTVISASGGNNGGFGGTVLVRTPDGFVEQYNHLREMFLSPGQVIPPGTRVGLMGGGEGDPNAGSSTGRHLHFVVYKNGTPDDQLMRGNYQAITMNPVDYMRMRGQQTATAPGVGRPPNQPAPANNNPLSRGQQLWQSLFMVNPTTNTGTQVRGNATGGDTIQNNATPYNQALASTRRNPYREGLVKNDGEANHGYQALRTDRSLRIALHQTASRLGIPSQWLADLVDYETAGSWDPGITNGLGCIGLQFCGGGELDEVAKQFNGNRERARAHLRSIGLVGQLRYLEQYFVRYANGGRDLTSIGALYAGWNGGPSRIRNPQSLPSDGPAASAGARRSGSALNHHINQLGRRTGRRYDLRASTRGADIGHTHTTATAGCPLCNEQLQKGIFTPHIGDIA